MKNHIIIKKNVAMLVGLKMIVNCKKCRKELYARPSEISRGHAKYCSTKCFVSSDDYNGIKKGYVPNWKGKKGLINISQQNGQWKGEYVGYAAIHSYIKRRLNKPKKCSNCKKINNKLDLANISQKYKRDLFDWEWLCRRCHMLKDGRLIILHKRNIKENKYDTQRM